MELLSSTTEDLSLKKFSFIDLKKNNIYIGGEVKDIYSETSNNPVDTVELSKTSVTPVNISKSLPDYSLSDTSEDKKSRDISNLLISETSSDNTSISIEQVSETSNDNIPEYQLSKTQGQNLINLENISDSIENDTEKLLKTLAKVLA